MTTLTKINKTYVMAVLFGVLSIYSVSVNFCPTPILKQFAPIIWVPMGLLITAILYRDPNSFTEKARTFPQWRKALGFFLLGGISCYLAQFIFVYGITDLVTKMIGTTFQESSIIMKKTMTRKICSHRIDVDKYQPASGGVCLDGLLGNLPDDYKAIWESSKKGDEVILIGKKSIFGSSITKILPVKQSANIQQYPGSDVEHPNPRDRSAPRDP